VVEWYKKYRDILNADIIHLRRADGRDWDGIMHVNPALKIKGMALLFNPLKQAITRTIQLAVYYTGLTNIARVREKEGAEKQYAVDRNNNITLTFTIAPESYTWFTIE
jgi:hypothetical protein